MPASLAPQQRLRRCLEMIYKQEALATSYQPINRQWVDRDRGPNHEHGGINFGE